MPLISSSRLDQALMNAKNRDEDAIRNAAITMGGDGMNEIDALEIILETLDKHPPKTPICIASEPDDPIWYYFIGSENDVIALLNSIT